MVKTNIADGGGSKTEAFVKDNALLVTNYTSPPLLQQKTKIFVHKLTIDGTKGGVFDMRVDGSGTEVEFYIQAGENDRYITSINFVIADEGARLKEFGHITALTNGCALCYQRSGEEVCLSEELKTNWDFIRMSLTQTPIAELKVQKDVEGKIDAYTPVIDFTKFMPPHGIKLDAGSDQKLIIKVRDNVSGVDSFNAVCYGFERFE